MITQLYSCILPLWIKFSSTITMLTRRWRARMQLWTRKSASVFLHGRALVNPEIESIRSRVSLYVYVYIFFILGLFPHQSSPSLSPRFSHDRRTRRGRFISTPVAIVPFVSQPALHASRRRAFSFHLLYLSASHCLSFSLYLPLCHPCSSW